jgi:hypothetical protein
LDIGNFGSFEDIGFVEVDNHNAEVIHFHFTNDFGLGFLFELNLEQTKIDTFPYKSKGKYGLVFDGVIVGHLERRGILGHGRDKIKLPELSFFAFSDTDYGSVVVVVFYNFSAGKVNIFDPVFFGWPFKLDEIVTVGRVEEIACLKTLGMS